MKISNKDKRLKVLAYHVISDKRRFEKQMNFLLRNYNIISLEDLLNSFANGGFLPEKALLITFDDGDLSLYKNAFPVLKKKNIPAIIFVISSLIGTKTPYWWEEIKYYLGLKEGNIKSWEVKDWPNTDREKFLSGLRENSPLPKLKMPQLDNKQLREFQDAGIIIANHSHTHPMLNQCTLKELNLEIDLSVQKMKNLSFTPYVFAYPNGNYSETSEKVLKKHGIRLAFLFDHKVNKKEMNPLRISRLVVNDTTPFWKFKFILSGWHSRILPITRRLGKLYK